MSKTVVWKHPAEEAWIERRDDGKYYAIDTSGSQYRRDWEAGIISITDNKNAAIAAILTTLVKR